MSALIDDPEARLDYLIDRGVLVEFDDGTVAISDDFHSGLRVYEDTYLESPEEEFVGTVAEVFDLPSEEAADRIEATGMTRRELAAYLALRSFLDDPDRSRDELVLLTAMVVVAEPASPVPPALTELDDGTFEAYVADHEDVVVFVLKRNCAPCDVLKENLPEITDAAPAGVSFAGVDGEDAQSFRRTFEVSVAPTTLVFSGGDLIERFDGGTPVETVVGAFEAVYDGEPAE